MLSDDDDPVPDPEHDKFNLANQVPREVLVEAREKHNSSTMTQNSSAQTQEEQDRNIVRVKFESYWQQKEEKRRKKAESEALHKQEMDALKESVKRAEEVGQSVSKSVESLHQTLHDSIQESNRTNQAMMQGFFQMLQGAGFSPALQSSYSQGQYPPALSFKTPADVAPQPRPAIDYTPPATLPGVPTPAFGRTQENVSEEHAGEAAVEETPPNRAEGGRGGQIFGRSKQNEEAEASQAAGGRSLSPGHLCSDQAKTTAPGGAGTEETEHDRAKMLQDGCNEVLTSFRTQSPPDDDGDSDSASLFLTTSGSRGYTGISASNPSGGAADAAEQGGAAGEQPSDLQEEGGDDKEHIAGSAEGEEEHVEEEPLDYEPSPLREKEKEMSTSEEGDAYSLEKV